MPATDKDIYNEWAEGVSLANNFFEEIPTELDKPANFEVPPEQLPLTPVEVAPVVPVSVKPDGPEVIEIDGGGTILVEKTSRGWKATLESGERNIGTENFYGENMLKLVANLAKGKLEASRTIRRLKKDKMLGSDEPSSPVAPPAPRNLAQVTVLTGDDIYAIKNAIADNPAEAFDIWVEKRFGLKPEEFAEALKSAPEAKRIVDAQKTKGEVEEVNQDFVSQNPDYVEFVSTSDDEINRTNIRVLVGRMAKAYLNRKITKSTSQTTVDDTIYDLHKGGFWTVDNLETAKEELVENGLFERPVSSRNSQQQPQPVVAPSDPSVPAASRIAAPNGQPVGIVGLAARSNTPAVVPESVPLSDVDLQKLPLDQLKAIAQAQLRAMQGR